MYYLLDIERTVRTGCTFYWLGNKHGYTRRVDEAGEFSLEEATEIIGSDYDEKTIMISVKIVDKLLAY